VDQERVALTPEETARRLGLGRTSTYKAIKMGRFFRQFPESESLYQSLLSSGS